MAVFDGHDGAKASDMAPKLLLSISFYILISFWMQHIQSYLFWYSARILLMVLPTFYHTIYF